MESNAMVSGVSHTESGAGIKVERESHNRRKNTLSGIGLFIFLSLVFHNYFTPNLARIDLFDGAIYIDAARGLTFGKLSLFSNSPGYAFYFSWF